MQYASNLYGGGGGVKSVQRGVVNLGNSTSATATVSAVNMSKSRLQFLGVVASTSSATAQAVKVELTNATTITATRFSGSGACTVGWELIEFT